MSRVIFFIGEGLRALRRGAAPSLAAIVTVAITILLLGVLIPILQTTGGKANEVRDQVDVRVFLYDDATQSETDTLETNIQQIPHVESVDYVSKQQALQNLRDRLDDPALVDQLPGHRNPLPASFEIQPDDIDNLGTITSALQPPGQNGDPEPISPAIEEVLDSRDDATAIASVSSTVKIFMLVIAALLITASLLLVGNTIRLSIYARRTEVEVMRLVGATNWFIRWPFMVEGLVCGLIGGMVAIGALLLGKVTIVDPLADSITLLSAQKTTTIAFPALMLILLAAATVVSALGSGFTLRRFLKV
ncbi:MAG: ABC transporter permease [Solirubrobacterales bacterium]|nr:ABC transporter permease [Solirubrobacterales bacterium]